MNFNKHLRNCNFNFKNPVLEYKIEGKLNGKKSSLSYNQNQLKALQYKILIDSYLVTKLCHKIFAYIRIMCTTIYSTSKWFRDYKCGCQRSVSRSHCWVDTECIYSFLSFKMSFKVAFLKIYSLKLYIFHIYSYLLPSTYYPIYHASNMFFHLISSLLSLINVAYVYIDLLGSSTRTREFTSFKDRIYFVIYFLFQKIYPWSYICVHMWVYLTHMCE